MKRSLVVAATAALTVITAIGLAGSASAAVTNLHADLTGAEEFPANGSTYTGTADITVDDVTNQVCATYTMDNPGSDPTTAAHIHTGAAGVAGPALLDFSAGSGTCVPAAPADVAAILAAPAGFYFNIHTQTFPGGGARGQLAATPPGTTTTPTTVAPTTTPPTTTPACHPAYTGVCIPGHLTLDEQVNCSPTPAEFQVMYKVRVVNIGIDPFRLDSDNDGIGCESLPDPPGTPTVQPSFTG